MVKLSKLRWPALALLLLGVAVVCGCSRRPAISTYTVTKDVPDRLLGGILLQSDRCWFFKITGPREELAAKADEFREFLKSVNVADKEPWTLPEGWELDETPRKMRVATIMVPLKSTKAELAVSFLPLKDESEEQQFLVANINRWRDQMSQARATPEDWKAMERLETKSGPALLVNISGRLKGGGMTPPFAGR